MLNCTPVAYVIEIVVIIIGIDTSPQHMTLAQGTDAINAWNWDVINREQGSMMNVPNQIVVVWKGVPMAPGVVV